MAYMKIKVFLSGTIASIKERNALMGNPVVERTISDTWAALEGEESLFLDNRDFGNYETWEKAVSCVSCQPTEEVEELPGLEDDKYAWQGSLVVKGDAKCPVGLQDIAGH